MCYANCLMKNIPRDWDCYSKGCLLDQKWNYIAVEGKPPCTPGQRPSAVWPSVKNTNPQRKSQGERLKCPDVRVSEGLLSLLLNSVSWVNLLCPFSESLFLKLPDFYWDILYGIWDADVKAYSELSKAWRRKKYEIQHCQISYSKNNQHIK